jgi:hypothetical protein
MTTKQEEEWTMSSSGKNKQVHLLPKDYSMNNLSVQHLHQTDDAPENILHVFIPRILTNVSKNRIIHAFEQQKIGKVFYIDAKFKVNQNQNAYGFAFVSVSMYDNEEARALRSELAKNGMARVIYDDPLYWEMKQYVPREKRAPSVTVVVPNSFASATELSSSPPSALRLAPNLVVPKPEIVDITTIESALRLPRLQQNTRSEALERDVIADRKHASSPVQVTSSEEHSVEVSDLFPLFREIPVLRATAPEFKYNVANSFTDASEFSLSPPTPSTNVYGSLQNLYTPFSEPRGLPDWSYDKDIQYIQKLCAELSSPTASFTSEDYADMEDDYSLFSREIFNYNIAV